MFLFLLSPPKIINMYARTTLHHAYVLVAILSVSFLQSYLCISAWSRSLMKCDAIGTSESMKTVTGQRPVDVNPTQIHTRTHSMMCYPGCGDSDFSHDWVGRGNVTGVCNNTDYKDQLLDSLSHTRKSMHSPCLSTLFLESYLCEKPDVPSYRRLGCLQSCLPELSLRT